MRHFLSVSALILKLYLILYLHHHLYHINIYIKLVADITRFLGIYIVQKIIFRIRRNNLENIDLIDKENFLYHFYLI